MRNKDKLISVIKKYGNSPFDKEMISVIEESIRLRSKTKQNIEIGESKFGGSPHLPTNIEWPKISSDKHYSFLLQLNLSRIKIFDSGNLLPETGILYFFFDSDSWDRCKVIFRGNSNELKISNIPDDILKVRKSFFQKLFRKKGYSNFYNEYGIELSCEYHLPAHDSIRMDRIRKKYDIKERFPNIFREEVYEYGLLTDEGETDMISNHHLLGIYNGIQNEYLESEFVKYDFKNPSIEEINEALKWKLLLQIDSDNLIGWSWGDWGKLYFFIHEDDLKNHNFDKVQVRGDCY